MIKQRKSLKAGYSIILIVLKQIYAMHVIILASNDTLCSEVLLTNNVSYLNYLRSALYLAERYLTAAVGT